MRWFVRLADLLSTDMCPRSQVRSQIKLHCFTLSNVWCLVLVSNDDSTNLNNCMQNNKAMVSLPLTNKVYEVDIIYNEF